MEVARLLTFIWKAFDPITDIAREIEHILGSKDGGEIPMASLMEFMQTAGKYTDADRKEWANKPGTLPPEHGWKGAVARRNNKSVFDKGNPHKRRRSRPEQRKTRETTDSMPSILTYNGIEMHSVATTRFEQSVQCDPSGTDALFSRFTIAVEGLIHAQGTALTAPAWVGNAGSPILNPVQYRPPDDQYNAVATAMPLIFNVGGVTIFQADGPISGKAWADLDNGPKPKRVTLSHFTAADALGPTFHVSFEIECAVTRCPSGDPPR